MFRRQTSPPRTILVADDDPDVRGILGMVLAHAGYEVVTAIDGANALAQATDARIGLILLDINMPRLQGDAFCRTYREQGGRAPVVVITASGIEAEAVARFGADGYIAKPFEVDAVLETVARHLGDR
jgi:DNA-binding response OmpR family regulator